MAWWRNFFRGKDKLYFCIRAISSSEAKIEQCRRGEKKRRKKNKYGCRLWAKQVQRRKCVWWKREGKRKKILIKETFLLSICAKVSCVCGSQTMNYAFDVGGRKNNGIKEILFVFTKKREVNKEEWNVERIMRKLM